MIEYKDYQIECKDLNGSFRCEWEWGETSLYENRSDALEEAKRQIEFLTNYI